MQMSMGISNRGGLVVWKAKELLEGTKESQKVANCSNMLLPFPTTVFNLTSIRPCGINSESRGQSLYNQFSTQRRHRLNMLLGVKTRTGSLSIVKQQPMIPKTDNMSALRLVMGLDKLVSHSRIRPTLISGMRNRFLLL